jgi:GAF domain-containing protein
VAAGEALSAVTLSFETDRMFGPAERAFGVAIAVQAATALERVRLFEAERGSRERARFRADLAEALRAAEADPASGPEAAEAAAVRLLGQHLRVSRVLFDEAVASDGGASPDVDVAHDWCDGVVSVRGRHALAAFGAAPAAAFARGEHVAVGDVEEAGHTDAERNAYAAASVPAHLGVPVARGGRFASLLAIHDCRARVWTPDEVALARGTAEWTWAAVERARAEAALRASEARYSRAMRTAVGGVYEWEVATGTVTRSEGYVELILRAGRDGRRRMVDRPDPPGRRGAPRAGRRGAARAVRGNDVLVRVPRPPPRRPLGGRVGACRRGAGRRRGAAAGDGPRDRHHGACRGGARCGSSTRRSRRASSRGRPRSARWRRH